MKNLIIILILLVSRLGMAQQQKNIQTVKERFENRQSQDFSVPPPPVTPFPAQYPKGNRIFIEEIIKNIDKSKLNSLPKKLATQIILKIDSNGEVLNVSTYGNIEKFNNEVKDAANKVTKNVTWKPGRNNRGEKVIDIVRLPVGFENKNY